MPRHSYIAILKYLRFDDKPNRRRSGPGAVLACVYECYHEEAFSIRTNTRCLPDIRVHVSVKTHMQLFSLTVDKQLKVLKTRCPFITFMLNEPDKYGIKFWALADVETKYVANIVPYLGAQEREDHGDIPLSEYTVTKLLEKITEKVIKLPATTFSHHCLWQKSWRRARVQWLAL